MPMGATMYYVFTETSESLNIQKALIETKLLGIGSGIVLIDRGGYDSTTEGALIFTEKGLENVNSFDDYIKEMLSKVIQYINENTDAENGADLRRQLSELCKQNHCNDKFSLVNIKGGEKVIVAMIEDYVVSFLGNVTFPGITDAIPRATKKILNLSIGAGMTNPNAAPTLTAFYGSRGA